MDKYRSYLLVSYMLFGCFIVSIAQKDTDSTSFQINEMATLEVKITGVRKAEGNMLVCLQRNSEKFLDDCQASASKAVVDLEDMAIQLRGLEPGIYAVSVFHDKNENDKLDENFLGIPKEDFGFSNNPKLGFGAPSFEACSFELREGNNEISINLKHLP